MNYSRKKNSERYTLINLKEVGLDYLDKEKIALFENELTRGIRNYTLFQKYSFFRWPFWIYDTIEINSRSFSQITPITLLNNRIRSWISFSNLLTNENITIDPTGMISPSYDTWSVEFWISEKGALLRPQEREGKVYQTRDLKTLMIVTNWEERDFELIERIYGVKTNIEEAIVEINCKLKIVDLAVLLLVIRPYNNTSISGIGRVEYKKVAKTIRINGYDRIIIDRKADYVLTGNGREGDIVMDKIEDGEEESSCKDGMATLALGYDLKKGENEFKIRMGPSKGIDINPGKIDFSKSKNDYIKYANLRMRKGFKLKFPDELFSNWFYGSKFSALHCFNKDVIGSTKCNNFDMKTTYYITSGYNRMGFHAESLKAIDSKIASINPKGIKSFLDVINACYLICAFSDYFIITRDIDFIKSKYGLMREIASVLYRGSTKLKEIEKGLRNFRGFKDIRNSIENYIILESNIVDIILLSFSLHQFSYLARCLGIFGDEMKFSRESERLEGIIFNEIKCHFLEKATNGSDDIVCGKVRERNDFFCYNIFAGYPFSIKCLNTLTLKEIVDKILEYFEGIPLYLKSIGGEDTLLSIIFGINLLLVKNSRVHDLLKGLMDVGKERYALPDIVNLHTSFGIIGEGDSASVISAFFTLMRNIIFMDEKDRLEVFPVPREEWFLDGSEIIIEDAPSKFGLINFNVISTKDEVHFHFNELPKYIPPDIMINLPFNVSIKQEDDFIIKNKIGNSYLINGWPSIIKFLRR